MRKIGIKYSLLMIGLSVLVSMLAANCQREEEINGLCLVAEGFSSGHKAVVEGNAAYWVEGETVRINGVDKVVQVSGSQAYVNGVDDPSDGVYRALYPSSLNGGAALTDNDVTVTIPRVYVYRVSDGLQALDLPMVAYGSASGNSLTFKHLTAAITVEVSNNFGIDIMVDSIVVSSNSYQLSGSRAITLGDDLAVEPNGSPASANDKRVVVRFNGGTSLTVASGDTARVQVPVLPVGEGNKFTITVATHNVDEPLMQYTFSRTQTTGGALSRKQMAYALASFGGVFTVSAGGAKVRFAPGNLQYYCNGASSQWRFALHQYDNAAYSISYYDSNTKKWIDLFGYATSGYDSKKPYRNSTDAVRYTPALGTNNIKKTEYDWGWHNSIYNGGNVTHRWHILGSDEWGYIKENYSSRMGIGRVNEIKGLVILPDNWTLPSGCSFTSGLTENTYSIAEWEKMEVAGAVFLPVNGTRNPTTQETPTTMGYYWTDIFLRSTSKASYIRIDGGTGLTINNDPGFSNYYGLSVRLVRDVE